MKIIGIRFQNLNSLKGVHVIRFDRPPFDGNNLFAITGATGAGKTTILDAITLALYGRVHRHTKDAAETMTRHTGEAYAEVEFETNDLSYRAKWSIRRSHGKPSGDLQAPKMELCVASTGVIIAEHPLTAVRQKIVEVCGLDYSQFLRSVMLSQGDFTRFLKAGENERSDLLERMTDTGIYSEISTFIYEHNKAKQTNLQQQMLRLDDVRLLSEEESDAYNRQLLELENREKTLTAEKNQCAARLQWLEKCTTLQKKRQELQTETDRWKRLYEENRPLFEQLQRHKTVSAFMPDLAELDAHLKNANDALRNVRLSEERMPALLEAFDHVSAQLAEAEKKYTEAVKLRQEAEPKMIEAEKLDALIAEKEQQVAHIEGRIQVATATCRQLRERISEMENRQKTLTDETERIAAWMKAHAYEKNLEQTITSFAHQLQQSESVMNRIRKAEKEQTLAVQQIKTATEQAAIFENKAVAGRKELNAINAQINALTEKHAERLAGKTLEEYETEAAALPQQIGQCERMAELAAKAAENEDLIHRLTNRRKTTDEQITQTAELLEDLTEKYDQAQQLLQLLHGNVKMQLLIRKYEEERKTLQNGSPCPLCGATQHPFVENNGLNEHSDAELKLTGQQQKTEAILLQMSNRKGTLQSLKNLRDNQREQQEERLREQQKIIDAFAGVNLQLTTPLEITAPLEIHTAIRQKKLRQAELSQQIGELRSIERRLQEQKSSAGKLGEEIARWESEQKQAQWKAEQTQTAAAERQTERAELEAEHKQWISLLSETLAPCHIELKPNEHRAVMSDLQQRMIRFRETGTQLEQKTALLNELRIELHHDGKNADERAEAIQQQTVELAETQNGLNQLKTQRFACFGDKNTDVERKRHAQNVQAAAETHAQSRNEADARRQDLEVTREQLSQSKAASLRMQEHCRQLTDALMRKIQAAGIESVEHVRRSLIAAAEASRIEELYRETLQQQRYIDRSTKETEEALHIETQKNLTAETPEALTAVMTTLEQAAAVLQQEMGRAKQIIETDRHHRRLRGKLAEEIGLLRQEADRWKKLNDLIGSADGKKFSRFAQGLTLERLVRLANRHVQTFTDRYLIRKTPSDDLCLDIIDRYQADVVRPVASLSGGESFLISLAMALGLSELAGRKTQINSLFIDEGFGMLDADTLDVAISALENLQANRKLIGIISHVEALKERIGIQIQVVKQKGGYSSIQIPALRHSGASSDLLP